jgi:hypothetical protein
MIQPSSPMQNPDPALAASLAKLWPHREHESNAVKNLFCRCNLHRWRQLDLSDLAPERVVHYCFWCSRVRMDGVVYDG